MQYLETLENFTINEKSRYGSNDNKPSLVKRFASFLGGEISKGWKKIKLKDLSVEWTQEYVKSIEKILKDKVSEIVIDDVPGKKTRQSQQNKSNEQTDETFYTELFIHFEKYDYLSILNDLIIKLLELLKTNHSNYKEVNLHLKQLKTLDMKHYKIYISKLKYSKNLNEFIDEIIKVDNIDISTKNNFETAKLESLSTNLEESLNDISNKNDDYETKVNERIKKLKSNIKDIENKLYTETDNVKIKDLNDKKDYYNELIVNLKDLSRWLSLQIVEAGNNSTSSGISAIIKKIKDTANKISTFTDFNYTGDSIKDKINSIEVTDEEKSEISNNINIKRLKIIQFNAENIFKVNTGSSDDIDFKLKNYWEKLLLEIDDKFQKTVNVDTVRSKVKSAKIDEKTKENLELDNEIINDTENTGITVVTNNYKKVINDTPFILGVKSTKNEIAYLILKKVNSNGNWFMLLNVYNKDKELSKDFFGQGIYELYLKNDIPIYINLDITSSRNKYVSLLYNYTNGLLYNKTKEGYKFSEIKNIFDKNKIDTKRKFFSLSYKDIKPDVNKRTFNVVLSGTADKKKIEEIYKLNVDKYKVKKSSFTEALAQHKLMIDYINQLK
jgi:hypothetical protein